MPLAAEMIRMMATVDHQASRNNESQSSSTSSESLEPRTMTSGDSTSTCSTSSSESKLERFNRMLRLGWKLFRKESMRDRRRERSKSDVGFYCGTNLDYNKEAQLAVPSEVLVRRSLQLGLPLSLQIIADDEARDQSSSRCYLASDITFYGAENMPAATGPGVVVDAESTHSDPEGADSDCERPSATGARVKRQAPLPPAPHAADESLLSVSSSNFSGAGGVAGPAAAARSAPATPLQTEAAPPPRTPVHSFAKCDKSAIKQLSNSAPSVSADVAIAGAAGVGAVTASALACAGSDAGSGDKSPRAPGKARQKKFLRHFPQVGPDERVLNYYSCALVGDILLQGHLYITKNYFAFYSNVFGYVTKLLIPIASVLRVSKEKLARIIPNAVGVATAEERHVFGSLLSRDTTYKYMLKVWKEATVAPPRDVQPAKELRVSEAELEASEYSQDDESSCSGSGGEGVGRGARSIAVVGSVVGAANMRNRIAATHARGRGDETGVLKQTPVIQPALLMKSPPTRVARTSGRAVLCVATLCVVALLLTISAALLMYRIHDHHTRHNFNQGLEAGVSGSAVYGELLRWQGELRAHSATQVHRFLTNNLQQLTKVRQSLEALSSMMITDTGGNKQSFSSDSNSDSTDVLTGS